MSPRLFLKLSIIAIVLLLAMSVATALIPGADKWLDAVSVVVIILAALAVIPYLRRHEGGRDAEQSQPSGQVDDSGRWKMGAVVVALGTFFLLGDLQSPLGYLMVPLGAALVLQYFWLKRKRAAL